MPFWVLIGNASCPTISSLGFYSDFFLREFVHFFGMGLDPSLRVIGFVGNGLASFRFLPLVTFEFFLLEIVHRFTEGV